MVRKRNVLSRPLSAVTSQVPLLRKGSLPTPCSRSNLKLLPLLPLSSWLRLAPCQPISFLSLRQPIFASLKVPSVTNASFEPVGSRSSSTRNSTRYFNCLRPSNRYLFCDAFLSTTFLPSARTYKSFKSLSIDSVYREIQGTDDVKKPRVLSLPLFVSSRQDEQTCEDVWFVRSLTN